MEPKNPQKPHLDVFFVFLLGSKEGKTQLKIKLECSNLYDYEKLKFQNIGIAGPFQAARGAGDEIQRGGS